MTKNFYNTYFEVKVDDAERPHIYNGVRTWVDGGVIPRFRKFFNLFDLKNIEGGRGFFTGD